MFHSISRHFSVLLKIHFVRNLGNRESFEQSCSNPYPWKSCDQCPPLSKDSWVWFMLISKKIWLCRYFKLSLFPPLWNEYLFLKCKIISWFHPNYTSSIICYCKYWTLSLCIPWTIIIYTWSTTFFQQWQTPLVIKKKKETKIVKINLSINFEIKTHKPLNDYLMYFGTDMHVYLPNNTKTIFFLVHISKGNKISNTH